MGKKRPSGDAKYRVSLPVSLPRPEGMGDKTYNKLSGKYDAVIAQKGTDFLRTAYSKRQAIHYVMFVLFNEDCDFISIYHCVQPENPPRTNASIKFLGHTKTNQSEFDFMNEPESPVNSGLNELSELEADEPPRRTSGYNTGEAAECLGGK